MPRLNQLRQEKSPYLLQHAANPVDWFPWGKTAFEKAAAEDKPVFLSIGYSTCHWCHVMAHESFEDEAVARLLNDHFVSVKVDREERPDIDELYMTVCQMMTGSGGWPLTVILAPDKVPFFAATYIPKNSRPGMAGLMDLLPRVAEAWKTRRDELLDTGGRVRAALQQYSRIAPDTPDEMVDKAILDNAYHQMVSNYDSQYGGFGSAPKFPSPHNFLFLLRYWRASGEYRAMQMVTQTLAAMRKGGIYDQVGLGFHRYSTDEKWLVPHFEKMLYDQAMLALAYLETYQATGEQVYARTAGDIFEYVLRDMTAPDGGFYSAEDADSEGKEGKFYLWTTDEVEALLGDIASQVIDTFQLKGGGNFFDPLEQKFTGENIPHLTRPPDQVAAEVETARQKMFAYREQRIHPHKDDKILTDWNGLMIAALAKGYQVLDEPAYLTAAKQAAAFIDAHLTTATGELLHRYRDGEAGITGQIDDYAFLIFGLIALYQACFEPAYLGRAVALADIQVNRFRDTADGGFFSTADNAEELLVRRKTLYDGATPSGNSITAGNFIRLSRLTGRPLWEDMAREMISTFSPMLKNSPTAFTQCLCAVDFLLNPSYEIVIVGDPDSDDTRQMLNRLRRKLVANHVILLVPPSKQEQVVKLAPFTENYAMINGKATAYVCQNTRCHAPTTDPRELLKQVSG